ncbi:MAG: thioredoxin [Bacteroidota bacterium]
MTFSEITQSDIPLLVDFHAEWCGPCKMLAPTLKEIKNELGDRIKLVKIDIDKNQKLAQNLRIQGVPTLMIYRNGELKWRQSGVLTKHELIKVLTSFE